MGWKAFQQLCVSVASEVWGQTVQGFFDADDGGRDGAFYGIWSSSKGETFTGNFTVQCKFSQKPYRHLRLTFLKDELAKAARLASQWLADNYFQREDIESIEAIVYIQIEKDCRHLAPGQGPRLRSASSHERSKDRPSLGTAFCFCLAVDVVSLELDWGDVDAP